MAAARGRRASDSHARGYSSKRHRGPLSGLRLIIIQAVLREATDVPRDRPREKSRDNVGVPGDE